MAIYLIDYENTGVKGLYGIERLKEDDLVIVFYGPKTGAVPFDEHVKISTASSHVEYIKTTKTAKNYLDFQLTTYLGYLVAQTPVRTFRIVSKDSGYDSAVDFWSKRGMDIRRIENVAGEKKSSEASGKRKNAAPNQKQTKTDKQRKEKKSVVTEEVLPEANHAPLAAETLSMGNSDTDIEKSVETKQEASPENAVSKSALENVVPKSVPESTRKKIRQALKQENPHASVYRAIYACMLTATDKQSFNTALVRQFTQDLGNKYYKAVLPAFSEWMKHA